MKVKEVIEIINRSIDEKLAAEWDNSGLQVGEPEAKVTGILLCVDVTEEVVGEAEEKNCNLIVSHHPFLFSGVKSITGGDTKSRLIKRLIKGDISVYSSHTCCDVAPGGINETLAELLGLKNVRCLDDWAENFCRVEVYVPEESLDAVRSALFAAGVGKLGNYRDCAYQTEGEGMFTPLESANPAVGGTGVPECTREIRLEGLCLKKQAQRVVSAILKSHPYECPVYQFTDVLHAGAGVGIGAIGDLTQKFAAKEFINSVKKIFSCDKIKVSANWRDKKIKTVAVCGGSGAEYVKTARYMGADAMITADCKHKDHLWAVENGLVLICPTHFASEYCFISILENIIRKNSKEIPVFASESKDIEDIL